MATLYISEYANGALTDGQLSNYVMEPAVVEQTVAIAAGSAQSAAFNPTTRFVRLRTDAICSVKFGTNPTAAATNSRMPAATETIVGVPQGLSYKVAVITNT